MRGAAFPKSKRLTSNTQFRKVMQNRVCAVDSVLIIYVCPNDLDFTRLGVSVGKGCGPATVRNRLKRLIREAFRRNQQVLIDGFDYVAMPTRSLATELKAADGASIALKSLTFGRINSSFLRLIAQLREKTQRR